MGGELRIEPVRGTPASDLPSGLVPLWEERGRPGGDPRTWLEKVAVALLDADGRAVGSGSVGAESIPFVAGRTFWAYQALLAPGVSLDWFMPMLGATFDLLAEEFAATGEGPSGVFLSVRSRELMERYRRFVWEDPAFMFAGYLTDGGQARLRYFEGATI